MCGIIGYAGSKAITNRILIAGLQAMEYRGYDSAGIAVSQGQKIKVVKAQGKVIELQKLLSEKQINDAFTGIAHTRWATHGEPSVQNAHPH